MRVDPASYRPILGFHFQVNFTPLDAVSGFVVDAKASSLPSVTNNPIVVDYGNTYTFVKGKTRWNEIAMTFYLMSTPDTGKRLWDYLETHQKVADGTDAFKKDYMKDVQIKILNPDGSNVGTWKLINAFISGIDMGNVDWSSEDVVTPEVKFVYDYATYTAG